MPSSEKPLTPMNAELKAKRCRFSSARSPATEPSTRRTWPPSSTQSIVGTSASRVATARLLVSTDRRSSLPPAMSRAIASTVVPLSRNTESPSSSSRKAGRRDGLLALAMRLLAPRELAVDVRVDRERASVRPLQEPALLKRAQILANGRLGDAERLRKLADPSATAHRHKFGDPRLPFVREYRPVRRRALHGAQRIPKPSSSARMVSFRRRFVSNCLCDGATDDKTSVIETSLHPPRPLRLGVLTSGGDAPGMNAAIAGVCERVERLGGEACGIRGGFAGLAERRADPLTRDEAHAHAARGGHLARHEPLEGARDRGGP